MTEEIGNQQETVAEAPLDTVHKALALNMDVTKYGTFAEIGAGQEVAGWFFHAGHAAGTVAKSVSAYDMKVSDSIYGPTSRYVSRERLTSMLDHEYAELLDRLDAKRGENTTFFVYADTVATRRRTQTETGHGWLGIRFQNHPRREPSEIIIHVQMFDQEPLGQAAALGIFGVNLIYAAFHLWWDPISLLKSLREGLRGDRGEVDMVKFSGPAFEQVDNRLISLQLVELGLTKAAMFTAQGEVVQPGEVLYHKPVLIERGSFRPITNVTLDMLSRAQKQIEAENPAETGNSVVLMEMTLSNLMEEKEIDHKDFVARADILAALGKNVLISSFTRFDGVTEYLRQYTKGNIGMAVGVPTLLEIFKEEYYTELEGGILEGLGRLFHGPVKLYVYPTIDAVSGQLMTAESPTIKPELKHLYEYLWDNKYICTIRDYDEAELRIIPGEVLAKLQAGDASWEPLVPAAAAKLIKEQGFFGYPKKATA
jgi:hypothetical protein